MSPCPAPDEAAVVLLAFEGEAEALRPRGLGDGVRVAITDDAYAAAVELLQSATAVLAVQAECLPREHAGLLLLAKRRGVRVLAIGQLPFQPPDGAEMAAVDPRSLSEAVAKALEETKKTETRRAEAETQSAQASERRESIVGAQGGGTPEGGSKPPGAMPVDIPTVDAKSNPVNVLTSEELSALLGPLP